MLVNLKDSFITFPTVEGCMLSSEDVMRSEGFRGFVGAVDGCHMPVERPREDEHVFVNRRGLPFHRSMGVCDERLMFTDICVGWPGSVHDSRIFKNSNLGRALTSGERTLPEGCFLVGDSAFQLEP